MGAGAAFAFAGAGVGKVLAVSSGFLVGVTTSGEATCSEVAPAVAGAAFGFAGAGKALAAMAGVGFSGEAVGSADGAAFGFACRGVSEALAVASGFLADVGSSGEAAGSAVAVAPCSPVDFGVAVDPGGHVIQHSASAGTDRNVNPVTATNPVSRSDFAFMIPPPIPF